jgi:uncharacterized protein (TIGR02246 family)
MREFTLTIGGLSPIFNVLDQTVLITFTYRRQIMFRKAILTVGLSAFALFILSVCQSPADKTEADVAAIQTLVQTWGAAVEADDIAGILALYTDDIVQMPPDAPANRGKQAIEKFYSGGLKLFSFAVTWPVEGTEEVIVADGWAFYISEYIERLTPKAGGEEIEESGKIIEICKKQPDGSWKFAREIWNSNGPPAKE